MNINDIQAIDGYADMTPQEIADALNAIPVTRNKIALGDLLFLLNNRGMMVRLIRPADGGEKWTGSVVNMINFVNDSVPAMAGPVNQWFGHITNDRNEFFDTTMPEYGGQLRLLASQFGGQQTMPTVADFDAIAERGGGWKYDGVTAAQVTAVIDKSTAMQAYRDVHSAHIVPVLDGSSTTKAALAEAFRDAATVLETI